MDAGSVSTPTVTLLFTDIEGSTKLLERLGEAAFAEALAEHRRVLREAFARHGGTEVDTQGDAFFYVFSEASRGLDAADEAQSELESGPIRVRMGVHTGSPLRTDEGYVGVDVHRAARIAAAGHGGQVLVSAQAAASAGSLESLVDLGEHRLKDLGAPERIYQLGPGTFAPLKTLSPSNLPVPATPFLGRATELERLGDLLADPNVRLVTVLGPGGIGKTRLALQGAAESFDGFLDGLWWVALAPLRDAEEVATALARALGVREEEGVGVDEALRVRLEGRRALVLLDNAEHLLPDLAPWIGRLLEAADRSTVLVTSRERLQLSSEVVLSVPPLSSHDAADLLQDRAAAMAVPLERTDTVAELCERLDGLPLALQLAAARLRTFSPDQLLERLSGRLDILRGGRDLEPRQQTLRATIEWSHDLLIDDEQALFRRLSVFVGGCTLEAAEAVAGGDVDTLQGLLDKSLVLRRDDETGPRYWTLESIHEFAAERLDASGEKRERRAAHADHFRVFAKRTDARIDAGDPEEGPVSLLEADLGNLRAAVDFGLETADAQVVREITASLHMYWVSRGLYAEGRAWVDRALRLDDTEDDTRRRLLSALATIAYIQGDHPEAVEAADAAASLAAQLGGVTERFALLKEQGFAALVKDDFEAAEASFREGLTVALDVDNGVGASSCRLNLAYLANKTGRHDLADELLAENLPFVRARGQARCEATTLASLVETDVYYRDEQDGLADDVLLGASLALRIRETPLAVYCLDLFALAAASRGDGPVAATILAATERARDDIDLGLDDDEQAIRARALERIDGNAPEIEEARAAGRELDLASVIELAGGNASSASHSS